MILLLMVVLRLVLHLLVLLTKEVVLMSTIGLCPDDLAPQVPDLRVVAVNLLNEFTEPPVRLIGALLYLGQRATQRRYTRLVGRSRHRRPRRWFW